MTARETFEEMKKHFDGDDVTKNYFAGLAYSAQEDYYAWHNAMTICTIILCIGFGVCFGCVIYGIFVQK